MKKKDTNLVRHINLDEIENPKFLATLNYDELDTLASDLRNKIIDVTSNYGGYLSSNLGAIELTIAFHRVFDLSEDKVVFDVGHQSYAHKILTGRKLDNLRGENVYLASLSLTNHLMIATKLGILQLQFLLQMALP